MTPPCPLCQDTQHMQAIKGYYPDGREFNSGWTCKHCETPGNTASLTSTFVPAIGRERKT